MRVNLDDRVALVTGAARGIGKAIADAFAANGARVLYTDIDLATATESAAQSPCGHALALDVTDAAQVEAVMDRVVRKHGRLDILVNNAGVNTLEHRVPIDQFPPHEWDRILRVDLRGRFLVSRAAARVMVRQGRERIIDIASVAGLVRLRLQSPVVAAKGGVVQ